MKSDNFLPIPLFLRRLMSVLPKVLTCPRICFCVLHYIFYELIGTKLANFLPLVCVGLTSALDQMGAFARSMLEVIIHCTGFFEAMRHGTDSAWREVMWGGGQGGCARLWRS